MATQVTLNSGSVDSAGSLALKTNGTTTAVTVGTDQSFNFSATGQRITGDFSNATPANRVAFQTSTVNGNTGLYAIPNGTATTANYIVSANSDPTNTSIGVFGVVGGSDARLTSGITGTGSYLPMTFYTGGSERIRVDTSGNVGIGTSSPSVSLHVSNATDNVAKIRLSRGTSAQNYLQLQMSGGDSAIVASGITGVNGSLLFGRDANTGTFTESARFDASGNLLVGATNSSTSDTVAGVYLFSGGVVQATRTSAACGDFGRLVNDGEIVVFRQAGTVEGTISVSGTTVSYNGGHLSRWAQTTTAKDDSLVKGTVLSNLDEMNVYTDAEGNPVDNEQLNKVKVSDVEGDANVAGVFVNWSHDDAHNVDEINMAMTGDMIIRIAQGVTVQRGDLLMSAGNGTAKPQGDDIVRSKTVAKVTSTHVTCTYADGSFCVPCVLMAC
jgi:hypothetical protein